MYIKWRSYVARHKHDFRLQGVIAMLKWCDKVDKGWSYMKQIIEEKINKDKSGWKHKTTKMKDGGLIAPNGKSSNLTPEQYKLVRSESFKEWFGDWENSPETSSKVIDENGEPLVVWHGSNMGFTEFNSISNKFFFSDNINVANSYRSKYVFKEDNEIGINENEFELFKDDVTINTNSIYEVFLNLRNPKIKNYNKSTWLDTPIERDIDKNKDGFIAKNIIDGDSIVANTYIAFEPNQIKLADGSNTTFDGNNPDIRFVGGGEIENELSIIIKGVTNENKYKGNYKKIFDLIEKDLAFHNPYGTSFEELKGNNFYITITPKPESFIIEQISKLKDVEIVNPDIRFEDGGQVQDLISQGVVELKMFDTKPEHAKEYGFDVKNPLYIQSICIQENERLKGIGKKVFQYIDEYAIKNGHDLIFGHITQKANFTKDSRQTNLCDIDLIKEFLIKSGYKIIEGNNDFYKLIKINPDIRFDGGGLIPANGTLVSKDKKSKLDYLKVGNDYEFSVFDGEQNPVENYNRVQYKKRDKNKVLMNYNQFVNYLYTEGYIDDKFKDGAIIETKEQNQLFFEIIKNKFLKAYPGISVDLIDGQIVFSLFEKEIVFDFYAFYEKHSNKKKFMSAVLDNPKISIDVDENYNYDKSKIMNYLNDQKFKDGGSVDKKDSVTLDIPLLIRTLELAREDVHSDAELHKVVENLLELKNKSVLTMDDYAYIAEIEHKHLSPVKMKTQEPVTTFYNGYMLFTTIQPDGATTTIASKNGTTMFGTFATGPEYKTSVEKMQEKIRNNISPKYEDGGQIINENNQPNSYHTQEEIDKRIMENQFGANNI